VTCGCEHPVSEHPIKPSISIKYGKFDWLRNYQLLERGPTDWSYLSSNCLAYAWALQYRKKRMKAGESCKANMLNGTCRSRAKQMWTQVVEL